MKKLKLMTDYFCYPLWDLSPNMYSDVDPSTLPISKELQTELLQWAAIYDATIDLDSNPIDAGFSSQEALQAFEKQGCALAEKLRAELGADYKIEVNIVCGLKNSIQ